MSEFEDFEYAEPVEALESADRVEVGRPHVQPFAVTEMYFNEDGSAKEFPDGEVALNAYLQQIEQQAAEEEQQLDPAVDYERPHETDQEYNFAERARAEAEAQASARAYSAQILDEVRKAGSKEDVRSEEAVGRAAAVVEQWRQAVFADFLAGGASLAQAFQGLRDLDNSPAVEAAIQQERYLQVTAGTSLAGWREGRQAQARKDALEGRQAQPDLYDTPSMRRMQEASDRYVLRAEQRQEQQRDANARAAGKWWR